METKLFEVRDAATFIPCFGVLMEVRPRDETSQKEAWLLRRAGFGSVNPLVLFGRLEGGQCQYDVYAWGSSARTMHVAHGYVEEHWNELQSGDVVDVEFILGEKPRAKSSEREL